MVYLHFPQHLTDEEEMLQRKYAKLRKKKKQLAALRAPKQEVKEPTKNALKRPAEAAADATEQAKKLLKSGIIKVQVEKKDQQTFKRTKRIKDAAEKAPVDFQPFSPAHSSGEERDRERPQPQPEGVRQRKGLYDSFISSKDRDKEREQDRDTEQEIEKDSDRPQEGAERHTERPRDHRFEDRRERDREPPKKGNTVYVHGHGVTEQILKKSLSNFGKIVNINMEQDKNCGFVTFETMEAAEEAIAQMSGSMVSGNIQLNVSMARRQPTFENIHDPSSASWSSIAASHSQKGSFKDKRDLVTYDEDLF